MESARKEFDGNAIVVQSDAASLGDIDTLAKLVRSDFEPIHAMFVNAGKTRLAPFEETTEGAYDELFALNAKNPISRYRDWLR